ncbi:MAG: ATP-dependent Clp protease adapter ClpS [Candidatus Thioglobus sp.]|nr:MAG: ATP-dependent Clp protease adapter ClpS [Candidatus Thioglobus sp.]KAA0452612.1 MAG: ATP-dependent Clp protease adapter ClpS [Candidatus Thioglobus sp.]
MTRITVAKKTKSKLKKPKRFQVLLLNDDYTEMDFVVEVLRRFFAKSKEQANAIMLKVHLDGEGVSGVYSHDVAQTKVQQVIDFARQNEQPLMCIIRQLDDS